MSPCAEQPAFSGDGEICEEGLNLWLRSLFIPLKYELSDPCKRVEFIGKHGVNKITAAEKLRHHLWGDAATDTIKGPRSL